MTEIRSGKVLNNLVTELLNVAPGDDGAAHELFRLSTCYRRRRARNNPPRASRITVAGSGTIATRNPMPK